MNDKNFESDIEQVTLGDAVAPDAAEKSEPSVSESDVIIADLNDKYMRAVAEIENTKRRAALDAESLSRNRAMSVANNFLPVVDAVAAALKLAPDDAGIIAMSRAVDGALAKTGIVKIESVDQQLNPLFHNAVSVVDIPKSDEPCAIKAIPNTIVSELQTGYMFGDAVLRPAMVVVGK